MTHKSETFDVAHTDAMFIIDPAGQERIVNEGMPELSGRLPSVLRGLLNAAGRHNLAHPELPWTATETLDDVYYLMGRNISTGATPAVTAPSAATAQRALAGSPLALTSLHKQAGQLLGQESALASRIRTLRGFPVVINVWASWCGPCRAEFPIFASASARFGRRVAFLGVDTNDGAGDARAFLFQHPVSYPSYPSSSTQLASLAVLEGTPTTIYIDRTGKVIATHVGEYATLATLENDVAHYVLGVRG